MAVRIINSSQVKGSIDTFIWNKVDSIPPLSSSLLLILYHPNIINTSFSSSAFPTPSLFIPVRWTDSPSLVNIFHLGEGYILLFLKGAANLVLDESDDPPIYFIILAYATKQRIIWTILNINQGNINAMATANKIPAVKANPRVRQKYPSHANTVPRPDMITDGVAIDRAIPVPKAVAASFEFMPEAVWLI